VTLRITRAEGSAAGGSLRLEGSLVGESVDLLEHECSSLLRSVGAVRLDLGAVGFVDRAGIEALQRLSRKGAQIRCRPGPVASVLEGEGIPVITGDGSSAGKTRLDDP
jgi:ABC-type transporter Mla MlaB component